MPTGTQAPEVPAAATRSLSGDLAWLHIGSALSVLEMEQLTGWLHVPGGRIAVLDGRLCTVEHGSERGFDALLTILGLEAGAFRFERGDVPARDLGSISASIVRCGEVLDQWWRLSQKLVVVDAELRDGHQILCFLDGSRSVAEAMLEVRGSFVEAVEAVVDALEDGEAEVLRTEECAIPLLDLPDDFALEL